MMKFDDHDPEEGRPEPDQWALWLEPLNGPMVALTTKPLSYDEAREAGRRMNEVRTSIGFGFKVVMLRTNH